jgi:glycine/D-amino acid oxidase-like deaminating enzyme
MTRTAWNDDRRVMAYSPLRADCKADVVIVGGGLTGMLSAYLLSYEGKKVIVLEKGLIGGGVTSLTTAFLTASIDTDFADLIKDFGEHDARLAIQSHQKAIDLIERIVQEHKIHCDFVRCSNYIYANSAKEGKALKKEYDAARKLGVNAQLVPSPSSKNGEHSLGFRTFGYIDIRKQAKFHPLKFLNALSVILSRRGVRIFEKTTVTEIDARTREEKLHPYIVKTAKHTARADAVLVATYEPFNKPLSLYFKKGTYTTYIIEGLIKNLPIRPGTYEDTENPYHYLRIDSLPVPVGRPTKNPRVHFLAGGEDHRSDLHVNPERNFNALIEYLDTTLGKDNYMIQRRWTGPILEPIDGLASIGPITKGESVMYALGFSGNGMTYSGITAMLFHDMVLGKKNAYAHLYDADRWPGFRALITKGKDYSGEMIHGAVKNVLTQSTKRSR